MKRVKFYISCISKVLYSYTMSPVKYKHNVFYFMSIMKILIKAFTQLLEKYFIDCMLQKINKTTSPIRQSMVEGASQFAVALWSSNLDSLALSMGK